MADCCDGVRDQFDAKYVERKRQHLERSGPDRTTRMLVDAIVRTGAARDASVLDVGAGLGAATGGLLDAGASRATHVEASPAQSEAARERAAASGHCDRIRFVIGDFVELADAIEVADVVVLDRVLCCYGDLDGLLSTSAGKATRVYAAVYPRDRTGVRIVLALENVFNRVRRSPFRVFAHDVSRIHELLAGMGFAPTNVARTFAWEVAVFERT